MEIACIILHAISSYNHLNPKTPLYRRTKLQLRYPIRTSNDHINIHQKTKMNV